MFDSWIETDTLVMFVCPFPSLSVCPKTIIAEVFLSNEKYYFYYRQVITVLTPFDAKAGWSTSFKFTYISTAKSDLSQFNHPGKYHVPEITYAIEALHLPRAM